MPRGGRGAVHLVLGVQREHDVQRARKPRVRPIAAHPRTYGFTTLHPLRAEAMQQESFPASPLCAATPNYLWHPHAACQQVAAHEFYSDCNFH